MTRMRSMEKTTDRNAEIARQKAKLIEDWISLPQDIKDILAGELRNQDIAPKKESMSVDGYGQIDIVGQAERHRLEVYEPKATGTGHRKTYDGSTPYIQ